MKLAEARLKLVKRHSVANTNRKKFDKIMGSRVSIARITRGLSQAQLAKVTGIPCTSIRMIETGKQGLSSRQLFLISVSLDMPLTDILDTTSIRRLTNGNPPTKDKELHLGSTS